jgi:hypothetical protein
MQLEVHVLAGQHIKKWNGIIGEVHDPVNIAALKLSVPRLSSTKGSLYKNVPNDRNLMPLLNAVTILRGSWSQI